MDTFKILDLFSGAGGAAMGLYRAFSPSFRVSITGVDIKHQRNYPAYHQTEYAKCFNFVQVDALEFPLEGYDFIWASPPCQRFTKSSAPARKRGHKAPDYIADIRAHLIDSEAYWTMENVPEAPLMEPFMLCGLQFGLKLQRHRIFESNFPVLVPYHPPHDRGMALRGEIFTIVGGGGKLNWGGKDAYHRGTFDQWKEAMGIDWMNKQELTQAVPPAYSEFIGRQLRNIMERKRAAV